MIQERVIIRTSADTFDVIAGYKLNTEPLSLADANRLARTRIGFGYVSSWPACDAVHAADSRSGRGQRRP
jgi:hypothetical protein